MKQELILAGQRARLLANGKASAACLDGNTPDHKPVVKLFTPWAGATWLLTELDPDDEDIAFGLCDLGMQSPELGSVRISEIAEVTGPGGLKIERDINFAADKTLGDYAKIAHKKGRIVA